MEFFGLFHGLKMNLKNILIQRKESGENGKNNIMYDKNKREEVKKHIEPHIGDSEEFPDLKILCDGCKETFSMQECCGKCPKFELFLELEYYRWCDSFSNI